MTQQRKVKVGLIGLGNIGSLHASYLKDMQNVELVGVCDIIHEKAERFARECNTKAYYSHQDLFRESGLEAVLIAVPHYDHTPIAVQAFQQGIHVLCEKPVAVHVNDAKKMMAAHDQARKTNPNLLFGLMFMERTHPWYLKIKDVLDSGELGRLTRVTWINTAWFRTQAYYNSGGWRATWAGEGGGILTNQCPHNLDMYQWLFGVPARISGHANIGKYHDIEVEDEVTAYFEHENGMVGHFIVTTAESPGTNRLEVIGENGKLVYENKKLVFYRNRMSMFKFSNESKESFAEVENWYTEIPIAKAGENPHRTVTEVFVQAILDPEKKLVANGDEGMNAVMIANGIMQSSFLGQVVSTPIDADAYEAKLKELARTSRFVKKTNDAPAPTNIDKSFNK